MWPGDDSNADTTRRAHLSGARVCQLPAQPPLHHQESELFGWWGAAASGWLSGAGWKVPVPQRRRKKITHPRRPIPLPNSSR
jgi:hypothetical protein